MKFTILTKSIYWHILGTNSFVVLSHDCKMFIHYFFKVIFDVVMYLCIRPIPCFKAMWCLRLNDRNEHRLREWRQWCCCFCCLLLDTAVANTGTVWNGFSPLYCGFKSRLSSSNIIIRGLSLHGLILKRGMLLIWWLVFNTKRCVCDHL